MHGSLSADNSPPCDIDFLTLKTMRMKALFDQIDRHPYISIAALLLVIYIIGFAYSIYTAPYIDDDEEF